MSTPDEILPNLYLGNVHNSLNKELLQRLEITHILNCAAELGCKYPEVIHI